ncbi:MAG TPA: hypothetical protein VHW65_04705 [Gemmatimonadales bacterium]|jgi:hypothetical protein|nr:hypothetical protein [Gemmatimonadales bacterium]
MTRQSRINNRKGAAVVVALLICSIAVAAMALGGIMLSSGAQISTKYSAKEEVLQAAADGGLSIIRDSINRGSFDALLPDSGYTTLVTGATVPDASGNALPGITRSLYVGRTGGRTGGAATAGQYGSNFASGLSIISDRSGAVAARRLLMTQESWAQFAVAINNWSGSAYYGCGESVNGPFFSNTTLSIQSGCTSPKTTFSGPVSVVGSITNQSSGNFKEGVKTGATAIPWPTPARINLMRQYAQDADAANGDYDITSPQATVGNTAPAVHIEFVTIDVNGDGKIEWDEGFMRVWVAANTSDSVLAYATGRRWPTKQGGGAAIATDPNLASRNCGAVVTMGATTRFFNASDIYTGTAGTTAAKTAKVDTALSKGTLRRCYLGGDPHLFTATTGDTLTPDSTITNATGFKFGWWKKRRSGAWSTLGSVRSGDKSYLIPLGANPNFKGVIFVNGDVALSGRLRGRVSVFATGDIVMSDDLLYTTPPGTECDAQGDIFGAIATKDVVIEDNNLQTPFFVNSKVYGGFDDTGDANYNMFFLAAGSGGTTDGNWYGEGVVPPFTYYTIFSGTAGQEPTTANASWDISAINQSCATAVNGCVRVTGGLAQGRVDDATYYGSGYYGWAEAHTYDRCGSVNPPPYFPTTGRFIPSRYYELDPVWLRQLTVSEYFRRLQAQ